MQWPTSQCEPKEHLLLVIQIKQHNDKRYIIGHDSIVHHLREQINGFFSTPMNCQHRYQLLLHAHELPTQISLCSKTPYADPSFP
ncbi:hypothetical protein Sjap_001661 [Stephania japonica]|uniref:Uncharacterized protein n=1 Tax=Stephania japonica TaxID=461633 RepID=A0AAP0PV96_9MAGN